MTTTSSTIRRQVVQELGLSAEDAQSLTDLIKFEPTERPPTIQTLLDLTHNRFDRRYLKYLYQRFKNECPCGRMNLANFKLLLGSYLPNRTSDEYFERMFNAFLHASNYPDQLTFKDLIVCLSLLQNADAKVNAEWTMRLINGNTSDRISFEEFRKFVQSIFMLNGAISTNLNDSNNGESMVAVQRSIIDGGNRASVIFKEIDTSNRKYLTVEDLEMLFQNKGTDFF
ncbi:hypothetical protein M3Y94_00177600 [Aphelenchoides besseyi]|nr:hypothetical protein M3Y94_00177600 [Aphelenchoides besseyi]